MSARTPLGLGLAGALLAATAGEGCIAYNETCTAFVDDPDGIVGYLSDAATVVKDEIRIDDAAVGQLVAESYLHAFDDSGLPLPHISVENAGGIRDEGLCEPREELPSGPVRRKTLREVLPFDNTVRLVEISAEGLKNVLEHAYSALATLDPLSGGFLHLAGLEVAVDCSRPAEQLTDAGRVPGERVTALVLRPQAPIGCANDAACPAEYPDCVRELVSLADPAEGELLCGNALDLTALAGEARIRVALNSFLAGGNDYFIDFADPAVTTPLGEASALSFQLVTAHFSSAYTEAAPFPGRPADRIVLLNCQ